MVLQAHQNLVTARALQVSGSSLSKPPYETLDWSSLAAGVRVAAGLPGFDSSTVSCIVGTAI
jgi:hypothetical protein